MLFFWLMFVLMSCVCVHAFTYRHTAALRLKSCARGTSVCLSVCLDSVCILTYGARRSATPQELRTWFGDMKGLNKIGLVGEDGYCYKWPGSPIGRWDVKVEVCMSVCLSVCLCYECVD